MGISIRLLPYAQTDGPHNMAADEVMLEAATTGLASIRLYGWNPPTLSLGYFQRHADRTHDPRLAAMPWVRRATGGGAIDHTGDLTYAIALPRDLRKGLSPADWHCRIHHVLADALRDRKIAAEVMSGRRAAQNELDFMCFAVPQPGDVIVGNEKIIGGAQRLRAGALLQHGSIQVPALVERADELARHLVAALGWNGLTEDWSAAEQRCIEELATSKYCQDWWNKKR